MATETRERRLDATTSGTGSAGVAEAGGAVLVAVVVANMRSRAGGAAHLDVARAVLTVHVEEVGVVLEGRLEVSTAGDELVDAERLVLGRLLRRKKKWVSTGGQRLGRRCLDLMNDRRLVGGLVNGDGSVDLGVFVGVANDLGLLKMRKTMSACSGET
jgi:hypothetical protein